MEEEKLVPLEKVIEDMGNPDGGMVSYAATDYYYTNYLYQLEEDQKEKELQEMHSKILKRLAITVVILLIITVALAIFNEFYR